VKVKDVSVPSLTGLMLAYPLAKSEFPTTSIFTISDVNFTVPVELDASFAASKLRHPWLGAHPLAGSGSITNVADACPAIPSAARTAVENNTDFIIEYPPLTLLPYDEAAQAPFPARHAYVYGTAHIPA
jgi:hypothetical protein